MKKLILFFVILLAAIWVGLVMHRYPGFVMINFGHTRIETTLWFAVLGLVVVLVLLYVLMAFLRGILNMPTRYANWSANKKAFASKSSTQQAIFALFEDDYEKAEKDFLKSTKTSKEKFLNYLGAAKSAQLQKQYMQRDKHIKAAKKHAGKDYQQVIDMISVRWYVQEQCWDKALKILDTAQSDSPFALKMRKRIYIAQENWGALKKLLPEIKKKGVLKGEAYDDFRQEVILALLENALAEKKHDEIDRIWKPLPKKFKTAPDLLSVYAAHLIDEGENDEAEALLSHVLKTDLDSDLLVQYGNVKSAKPSKQLKKAEGWLADHPDNFDLLFCLGRLCKQYQLWGKAKTYFEAANKAKPAKQSYEMLGEVLENLGEDAAALVCYREGLLQQ